MLTVFLFSILGFCATIEAQVRRGEFTAVEMGVKKVYLLMKDMQKQIVVLKEKGVNVVKINKSIQRITHCLNTKGCQPSLTISACQRTINRPAHRYSRINFKPLILKLELMAKQAEVRHDEIINQVDEHDRDVKEKLDSMDQKLDKLIKRGMSISSCHSAAMILFTMKEAGVSEDGLDSFAEAVRVCVERGTIDVDKIVESCLDHGVKCSITSGNGRRHFVEPKNRGSDDTIFKWGFPSLIGSGGALAICLEQDNPTTSCSSFVLVGLASGLLLSGIWEIFD